MTQSTTENASGLQEFVHEQWSSRGAFVLACVGGAIGLGNIWRFPYVAGQNGGGAFVLIYCGCVLLVGLPLMMAEIAVGRRGGQSAVKSMRVLTRQEGRSRFWAAFGWLSLLIPFMGLLLYSVVAGWIMDYLFQTASGAFADVGADDANRAFDRLTHHPLRMAAWHGLFILLTIFIVAWGVHKGIERAVKLMIPGLAVIIVVLLGYLAVTADFVGGLKFLFNPDFYKVDGTVVLTALGQAFFSLSIAVGALITYGAYMPKRISIPASACTIAAIDTFAALAMGMVVFPLVITYGLQAGEGPGLVFVSLPIAFGTMPAGTLFGTLFFVLMLLTALTSSIAMLEPLVSWGEERRRLKRPMLAVSIGAVAWLCGLSAVMSFNVLADVRPLAMIPMFADKTIFDLLDFAVANVLIPAGGLLLALFTGWVISRTSLRDELDLQDGWVFRGWYGLVRYVAPAAIIAIVVANLAGL